ncbi:methyl-accepting chemotaxis protein [Halalkalibacterium halodurans]|uniref:Methyl-accepting chemotaxis protein n=1 Tax=Halalkalibacterium halodurans (strain ATCC BAA-125 / DSM 18197 / FERM 7344 / JCM 9153 / C-125) TaxID=272558 RepID=Q9K629_HALH5|nr:methyl-accepting chemotaxis protein [Halalkalibacterium halodurans]MDY7224410.1 methyl-accepting chemotaxis protein [Halalkalibacterium halodurans]MDY7243695.1 methyl-accepting chemotaxis protein [Halalkalibacterium halodurans]MED3645826.1 methyl-accepting chemotaxis protein [Halalkalibacterium halodurans]MED4079615.1 methyl-accepting chemotaxis protein [Halalkalibacterium halodurans]MED4084108.1 methyl-accepting chemotaxis protein [Halalkalibacterium halodurans]
MTLRTKMLVLILGSVFIIFGAVSAYSMYKTNQISVHMTSELMESENDRLALEVQLEVELALDSARALAHGLQGLKENDTASRDEVNAMLTAVLRENPTFIGTWTIWEPDAFDGKDEEFAGTDLHDATGRYIPYFYRGDNGQVLSEPSRDYDVPGDGDYYLVPKEAGKEVVLEPYLYEMNGELIMFLSVAVPVIDSGETVGVVGIDLSLDYIQDFINDYTFFDTGYGLLISNEGQVVSHPQAENVGGDISTLLPASMVQRVMERLKQGEDASFTVDSLIYDMSPVRLGQTDTPWSVMVIVPQKEVMAESRHLLFLLIGAVSAGLILITIIIVLIANNIIKPIKATIDVGNHLAQGDFTKDIPEAYLQRPDEVGDIARSFNSMKQSLSAMIHNVLKHAEQAAAASQELATSAEETKQTSNQIAVTINEIAEGATGQSEHAASILERMKTTVLEAQKGQQASIHALELANQSNQSALKGEQVTRTTVEHLQEVNAQVRTSVESVKSLGERSEEIGSIVTDISSIADQTNLLALNAAIEAARAGEHGKGFAVVAEEVRKLAAQSAESADKITQLVGGIQGETKEIVQLIEQNLVSVQRQMEYIQEVGRSLREIVHHTEGTKEQSQDMNSVLTQVLNHAETVLSSIEEISSIIEQSAASAEEVAAGAEEQSATVEEITNSSTNLAHMAEELNEEVSKFKL